MKLNPHFSVQPFLQPPLYSGMVDKLTIWD